MNKPIETAEQQFKRLNDESVLPMALDDGREILVGSVGRVRGPGTNKEPSAIYDYVSVVYRDIDGEEYVVKYYRQ